MEAHVEDLMSCVEMLMLMLMFSVDIIEECRGLISNMKVEVIVRWCCLVSVIHTARRIGITYCEHALQLLLKVFLSCRDSRR